MWILAARKRLKVQTLGRRACYNQGESPREEELIRPSGLTTYTRMALPEGMGTWAGAASIALLLGPVRNKLEQFMRRFFPGLKTGKGSSAT